MRSFFLFVTAKFGHCLLEKVFSDFFAFGVDLPTEGAVATYPRGGPARVDGRAIVNCCVKNRSVAERANVEGAYASVHVGIQYNVEHELGVVRSVGGLPDDEVEIIRSIGC